MSVSATQGGGTALPRREYRRQALIVLSLLFVLVAVVASIFLMQSVDGQIDDLRQTYATRETTRILLQQLVDAETGQRGYLLTRDEAYLTPYHEAVASIDSTYRRLLSAVADRPAGPLRIQALANPLARLRGQLAATIDLVAEDRVGQALSIARSEEARATMVELRDALGALVDSENAQLATRSVGFEQARVWLGVTMILALAGSVVLTYLVMASARRQLAALGRASAELQSLNAELEQRVGARTAELEEARAHAERERARVEMLLKETNHRIGNSLATVSSMLGLQITRSSSTEVRSALETAQERIHAAASAHRRLRLGDDLETVRVDEFLSAMLEDLVATQNDGRLIRLERHLDPMVIHARDATTIGIVVGELVTNALKHAFSPHRPGTVEVCLTRHDGGAPVLTVADNGIGHAGKGAGTRSGLGTTIVRQLVLPFGGEPRYGRREGGGTSVTVDFPALAVNAESA